MAYVPTYIASDLPLIGADAVGTAGAATVAVVPLAVAVGMIYGGVVLTKKAYIKGKKSKVGNKYKKSRSKPSGWRRESYRHSLARRGIKTKRRIK